LSAFSGLPLQIWEVHAGFCAGFSRILVVSSCRDGFGVKYSGFLHIRPCSFLRGD
jgi:hypothetical protein